MIRWVYRLLYHASILDPFFLFLSLVGTLGLIVIIFKQKNTFGLIYGSIIIFNIALIWFFDHLTVSFEIANPSYSIWVLPVFFLYLSASLADKKNSFCPWLVALCTLSGPLSGDYQMMVHGSIFTHGPYNQLEAMLQKYEGDISVIYDKEDTAKGMPYYALYYLFKGNIPQYEVIGYAPLRFKSLPKGEKELELANLSRKYIAVIQTQNQTAFELQSQIKEHKILSMQPQKLADELLSSANWKLKERETLIAFLKLEVFIFERHEE